MATEWRRKVRSLYYFIRKIGGGCRGKRMKAAGLPTLSDLDWTFIASQLTISRLRLSFLACRANILLHSTVAPQIGLLTLAIWP